VRKGRNQIEPSLPRPEAIATADLHQRLNRTQRSVIEDVLGSPNRIQGIQGFAGIGHPGLLSSRFGYVSISRASHDATPAGPHFSQAHC
jgi:hypothetical protein